MPLQILGVLDLGRDAWISREDWIHNGVHVGSNKKYKDSYYLQAQAMCYMNSWKDDETLQWKQEEEKKNANNIRRLRVIIS